MSTKFSKGDKVICVTATVQPDRFATHYGEVGKIYTVAEDLDPVFPDQGTLKLEELKDVRVKPNRFELVKTFPLQLIPGSYETEDFVITVAAKPYVPQQGDKVRFIGGLYTVVWRDDKNAVIESHERASDRVLVRVGQLTRAR